jgi:adenine deaminase
LIPLALLGGTTTIVTETEMVGSAMGAPGVEWFLDAVKDTPMKIFATAPSISYLLTDDGTGAPLLSQQEMERLLDHPRVLGLGEIYWDRLLFEPEKLLFLMAACRARRKWVEGHTAGAKGAKLQASVAAGLTSCHEPIRPEEALERLRLGLHTLIREGSVRRDLEAVAPIRTKGISLRRATLTSDSLWPHDMEERGYMDGIVQRAIDLGFEPIEAIQMASLNVAEHFGLDGEIGGIAPGKYADIVVLPELRTIKPEAVISNGAIVAWEGRSLVNLTSPPLPPKGLGNPRFPRPLTPDEWTIRAEGRSARVRAIQLKGGIVTSELIVELPVQSGTLRADPARDLLKVVAFDRRGYGRVSVGFVEGFGLREGAIASSIAFDTADVVVAGSNDEEITLAAKAVLEAGGGYGVTRNGRVLEFLPFPVGGILSNLSGPEVASRLTAIESQLRSLGCLHPNPFLALQTLTFKAIPSLRISSWGLYDVKTHGPVDLFVR